MSNIHFLIRPWRVALICLLLCSLYFTTGTQVQAATGPFNVTAVNTTDVAWGNFHFLIFAVPGFDSTNVFFDLSTPPVSSQVIDSLNILWDFTTGEKKLDLFFYNDPLLPGETGSWEVSINNPDNTIYAVTSYPSVVPEPVSSTLFIIGAATLGYRRFRKR